jgi:TPR repeat protein
MIRIVLIALICLLNSVSVAADEFSDTKALADQGDAQAQFNLALMYYEGEGVPQDYAEAIKWFRKGAEQGLAAAQYNLALMYYEGEGVPQDYAEAIKWFRKAAEQGLAAAQFTLALMYATGQGVPQDYVESYVWNSLAAASGFEDAIHNRDIVAKQLSPADLGAAKKRAAKLFEEIPQRK